jgi:hypothetical protein
MEHAAGDRKCEERRMSEKPSRQTSSAVAAGFALAAFAVLLGAQSAEAGDKRASQVAHSPRHGYATDRSPRFAHPQTLPYGPEYGFLTHVPPNAIRMPGYIFVPGVGILGESCDLPTSACPNRYRDHM